jgi:four helix bundle protein
MFTYRDLEVWQRGMVVVERIYRATSDFPREEMYGLTSQMRRAAISIPSNIAEGNCRKTTRVFMNHVDIALGSHGELETCLEASARLSFINESVKTELVEEVAALGRMLNGLYDSLDAKLKRALRAGRAARLA